MCEPQISHESPCPPVWDSIVSESSVRGPRTNPRAWASRTPASEPPASRTVVTPTSRVRPIRSAAWKKLSENGVAKCVLGEKSPSTMKWT